MAGADWGPGREYGIPGIDDQVPGSAAQQAGIAAAERGDDPVAAAVAAGGTSTDFSNPQSIWDAWMRGGAEDYNYNVFQGKPGYQSSNPGIFYGMSDSERAAYGDDYWKGSTLTPQQQAQVDAVRGGTPYASLSTSASPASQTTGGSSVANVSSTTPGSNPNSGKDWWQDWMVNFDPNDPNSMSAGWRNTLQQGGVNPYGNNPYQRWVTDDNLMQPLIQRWLVSKYLGGGFSQTDPTDMYNQAKGFLQGGPQSLMGAGDMINQLKNQIGGYLSPDPNNVAGPSIAPLVAALTTSDNFSRSLFSSLLGAGSGGAMMNPIASYVNMLYRMYQDSANAGGSNNFAQWMLGRM